MLANNIGERIAKFRKQFEMTQEQLAERLNVTSQAVSKWETGLTCPDISLLATIAEAFHISTDELLGVAKKTLMTSPQEDTSKLMLHIRVLSADGDRVNVNFPFPIVTKAIEMGIASPSFGIAGNKAIDNVDWSQLADAINMGLRGKIIDVQSADGDIVEVVVE